jgi:hypothetical protein
VNEIIQGFLPFKSIPAENASVPAPVMIATRLLGESARPSRRRSRNAHSSGSSSYHFQSRSISQHAAIVREFICFSRFIVTSNTWGTGISRSTWCWGGGGDCVDFGLMAIVKSCDGNIYIAFALSNPPKHYKIVSSCHVIVSIRSSGCHPSHPQ